MVRDPGLAGPSNFRDIGGYAGADGRTVRWGVVFRSDTLRFTDDDVALARDRLQLRTIVDLRTDMEFGGLAGGGKPHYVARLDAVGATRHHLPMVDETRLRRQAADERPIRGRTYGSMLERGGATIRRTLELLADEANLPLVFHCSAGKDRTGILAAVLLGLLGVDEATIVADYALSQPAMELARAKILARPDGAEIMAKRPPSAFLAPADAMESFVAAVLDRHGSWDGAAASIGVEPDAVTALRALLLH